MINIIAIGNLTKDAETTQSQSNGNVYNKFRIALNEGRGQNQNTMFIDVMQKVFNPEQNGVIQYLTKGKKVFVSGSITLDALINQQGQAFPSLTIWADKLELLGGGESNGQQQGYQQQGGFPQQPQGFPQNGNGGVTYQQGGRGYQPQGFPQNQQQQYCYQNPQGGDGKAPF